MCSIKKAILKRFVISTEKYLYRRLFFNKVAGRQACNFIKKRLQHKYFLANIDKFIRRPILKNIYKCGCIVEKCFARMFFRPELSNDLLMTCCVNGCSNKTRSNKNASYNKVLGVEIKFFLKKIKFLHKSKTTAFGKSFV